MLRRPIGGWILATPRRRLPEIVPLCSRGPFAHVAPAPYGVGPS